jgi:hypothetical protein
MAKASVGTITIMLEAQSKQFDSSMKKATGSVNKFQATVKAAGAKMNVAWTSMQSKISLVTGALELAFKSATSFGKLFSGDIEGAVEGLKALPLGIGAVVTALEGAIGYFTGWTEEIKRAEAAIKSMAASTKRMQDAWKSRNELRKSVGDWASDDPEKARLDRYSASRLGQIEIDQSLAVNKLKAEQIELEKGISESYRTGLIRQSRQIELANELSIGYADRIGSANEYFNILKDELKLQQQSESILSQGSKRQDQVNAKANHQLNLMRIQGASQEDILKTRLKQHADIASSLDGELKRLKLINAESSLLAAKQKEIDDHAIAGQRSLETSAAKLKGSKAGIGPAGASSSFSTAVGQIILPDERKAQANRNAQLSELKTINAAIALIVGKLAGMSNQTP